MTYILACKKYSYSGNITILQRTLLSWGRVLLSIDQLPIDEYARDLALKKVHVALIAYIGIPYFSAIIVAILLAYQQLLAY
jgi:hypothetical protein